MDSDTSSDGEYSGAKRGAAKRGGGKKKFDRKPKCALCAENFVDVDGDNEPTFKPCGCVFHGYCWYKASFSCET